jgi:two-component system nitrate/nitrite response regulator NarL
MMHVFVVSPVCLYREGVAELLRKRHKIEVIGTAPDFVEAREALSTLHARTDVLLLEVATPENLVGARGLLEVFSGLGVLAIAVPNREEDLLACLEAGVSGFVTQEASVAALLDALESVARGELLCSPSVAAALGRRVAALARDRQQVVPLPELTTRELEVVRLIDEGLSNKEIARRLWIEVPTVKNHVHHILGKLGVKRRAQAAARIRHAHALQTD